MSVIALKILQSSPQLDQQSAFDRDVHCLFGLPIDAVSMDQVIQRIRRSVQERTRLFLSTPNLNFLIACQSDKPFLQSVINSDLSIADGMPLVWMAGVLGVPIRERVAGSDLFDRLRDQTTTPIKIYFFGGQEGVAEAACVRLNASPAGLRCVGFSSPGFGSVEDMSSTETIEKINASEADFLVISLGATKGQAWIEFNRARISVPVISHLGAVINFVAGTIDRSPRWMRNYGLEWLWRVKSEPGLWRRYVFDGIGLLRLLSTKFVRYAWYLRSQRPTAAALQQASVRIMVNGSEMVFWLGGAWTTRNLMSFRQSLDRAAEKSCDISLDLKEVSYVDSAFLGLMILLYRHQRRIQKRLTINVDADLRRVSGLAGANFLLET